MRAHRGVTNAVRVSTKWPCRTSWATCAPPLLPAPSAQTETRMRRDAARSTSRMWCPPPRDPNAQGRGTAGLACPECGPRWAFRVSPVRTAPVLEAPATRAPPGARAKLSQRPAAGGERTDSPAGNRMADCRMWRDLSMIMFIPDGVRCHHESRSSHFRRSAARAARSTSHGPGTGPLGGAAGGRGRLSEPPGRRRDCSPVSSGVSRYHRPG